VRGRAARPARCGAFDDDLEVGRGWVVNADHTDTATAGAWQRGDPAPTTYAGQRKQPDSVPSGRYGFITGLAAGTSASANDVDGGRTSVTSPTIDLPNAAGQKLQFRWNLAHDTRAASVDEFRVEVLDAANANAPTTVMLVQGAPVERSAGWRSASIDLGAFAGKTIRLRFSATDVGNNGIVEAGFDDVRVTQPQ
jgi:aminopeptidase S